MQQKLLFCCVRFDKGLLWLQLHLQMCFCPPLGLMLGFLTFDSLQIVPSDFWRRHFLVHDGSFRKLGNCDFYRGVWYFAPIGGDTSFMGFIRDDVTKAWLIIPF